MLTTIDINNPIIKEKLLQEVSRFDYRFKRYRINYSVMVGFAAEPIDFTKLSSFIRKSDSFLLIAPNLYAVIFDFTNNSNGAKTANKLLEYLQQIYFSKKIYSCIVTASDHESSALMINELHHLLTYAIATSIDDVLVDNSYLPKVYIEA